MKNKKNVQEILEAISDVKNRATYAKNNGDLSEYRSLMGDLTGLEVCLVIQAQALMEEMDKIA